MKLHKFIVLLMSFALISDLGLPARAQQAPPSGQQAPIIETNNESEETPTLTSVTLSGTLYGRSSVNFKNKSNVNAVLPAGSKGDVQEVRQLRSGSYGVRVKVTELGANAGDKAPAVGSETWLYYSQKESYMQFQDRQGNEIDDPEESLVSQAAKDTSLGPVEGAVAKPALPSQETVLKNSVPEDFHIQVPQEPDPNLEMRGIRSGTEASFSSPCALGNCPTPAKNNREDIGNIGKSVRPAEKAPTPPAAVKKPTEKIPVSKNPNNKWANDPVVMKYSESAQVKKLLSYAMRNKRGHSKGQCYKYVKRALLGTGMVTSYPGGWAAKLAVENLKKQNESLRRKGKPTWVNMLDNPKYRAMIKSPADVPKGAIIVYRNGRPKEAGDTAIKTGYGNDGGYVSDFYSPRPITQQTKGRRYAQRGIGYEIIGVMITKDNE